MSARELLSGRRALVTGGASGIGAAIARRLASEDAQVVIADLDGEAASRLAAEIGASAVQLDVTDLERVREIVAECEPFDILVNNAGADQHAFFTRTTFDDWRRLLAVNLESVFATTHAALPAMQAKRYGRIINIASEAGRLGSRGGAVYAAAKAGVIAFTKSIARENARFGITCNYLASGPVQTPMLEKSRATPRIGDRIVEGMEQGTLLKRLGTPAEIAAAVAFVASEEAAFMTAEVFGVSGGMGVST